MLEWLLNYFIGSDSIFSPFNKEATSPTRVSRIISLSSILTLVSSNSKFNQWCSYSIVSACKTWLSLLSLVSWNNSSVNLSFFPSFLDGKYSGLETLPQNAEHHLNTSCLTIWNKRSVSTEFMSTLVYRRRTLVDQGIGSPVTPYGLNFIRLSLSASK